MRWVDRTREVRNLINPAFCSVILRQSVEGYSSVASGGALPLTLSFLVLPLVLHKRTRNHLPTSVATSLHAWLERVPQAKVGFPERAQSTVRYTREAMVFGTSCKLLTLTDSGIGLVAGSKGVRGLSAYKTTSSEVKNCIEKAALVGKLFGRAGSPASIYAVLGVKP